MINTLDVAVAVLINPQGEILIAQRPEGKEYAGWWEFPGGKIEADETALEAIMREMKEELSIQLDPLHTTFVGNVDHHYADLLFRGSVFTAGFWKGELKALEQQQWAWISPLELDEYQILASCRTVMTLLKQKTELLETAPHSPLDLVNHYKT